MDRFDQPPEFCASEFDVRESVFAQKDTEIRRLESELELRDLYMEELHALLNAQAAELAALDARLCRLEPRNGTPHPRPALIPPSIRVKKSS